MLTMHFFSGNWPLIIIIIISGSKYWVVSPLLPACCPSSWLLCFLSQAVALWISNCAWQLHQGRVLRTSSIIRLSFLLQQQLQKGRNLHWGGCKSRWGCLCVGCPVVVSPQLHWGRWHELPCVGLCSKYSGLQQNLWIPIGTFRHEMAKLSHSIQWVRSKLCVYIERKISTIN